MRRPAALVLLVLPLLAAACGGGGGKSAATTPTTTATSTVQATPLAFVRDAAKKTAAAKSEHMEMRASASFVGQSVTISGNGDFDNAAKAGSIHVDFGVGATTGGIDEVLTGTTVYLKSQLFASALPAGKTWIKLDLKKAAAAKGVDLSTLLAQNPSDSLAQLQGLGSVKVVGDATVGGVATTHYRGRVDLSKVPQAAQLQGLSGTSTPYDIWVGKDDGYVHRVRVAFSLGEKGTTASQAMSMSMTMDFSDFGKSVSVTAPSAAETYDATNKTIPGLTGG